MIEESACFVRGKSEPGYVTHLITKHALDFIDAHKDKPFALYLPHEAPHYPYQGPGDKADRTVGGKFATHGSRTDKKEAYREMVVELDKSVGQVLAKLDELRLDRKTLVFFFSDNGATRLGSNGPLRGTKGTIWEGGHRVPAIARWPGRIEPGTTDQAAIGMDLMPTLLKLAGAGLPEGHRLDGVDLSPLLFERRKLEARTLFWEHGGSQAMRDGPWKLVRNGRGQNRPGGLYNLAKDLGESRDLAAEQPQRLLQMVAALDAWKADVSKQATAQPAN